MTNSQGSAELKIISKGRKVAFFKDFVLILQFWAKIKMKSPKLPLTPNFNPIHWKTNKQQIFFSFMLSRQIKTTIMKFQKKFYPLHTPNQVSPSDIWLERAQYQKKMIRKVPLWSCFLAKFLISNDDLYRFWDIQQKPLCPNMVTLVDRFRTLLAKRVWNFSIWRKARTFEKSS